MSQVNNSKNRQQFNPKKPKPIKLRSIHRLILALYLICLCLPAIGFKEAEKPDIEWISGLFVLIMGLLLGWMGIIIDSYGSFAAYANLLLFYVIKRLLDDKNPIIAVLLMLFLASLGFFYRIDNGESPYENHLDDFIYYWGYGAFFWFMAILVSSFEVFHRVIYKKSLPISYAIGFVAFSFVLIFLVQHVNQYRANINEKRHFPKKAMLTTYPIVGKVNTINPDLFAITKDSVIEIDKNEKIATGYKTPLDFEILQQFNHKGYFWQAYRVNYSYRIDSRRLDYIAKLTPKKPTDYYYSVGQYMEHPNKYSKFRYNLKFSIYDKQKNLIWQGKNRRVYLKRQNEFFSVYDHKSDLKRLFLPLSIEITPPNKDEFNLQSFVKNGYGCTFFNPKTKFINNTFYLDDSLYYFSSHHYDTLDTKIFDAWCSQNYAIIAPRSFIATAPTVCIYLIELKKYPYMALNLKSITKKRAFLGKKQLQWRELISPLIIQNLK